MHIQPDIFVTDQRGLTRMQPDADAHRAAVGPFVLVQPLLHGSRPGARLQRAPEDDEEGIALGPQLMAAIGAERLALDDMMREEDVRIALAEFLDQPRR